MSEVINLVRSNILALLPYSSARDEHTGAAELYLDANENPFGNLNRYPDPYQNELRKKIGELKSVPIDNIFLGNGSDEAIDLLIRIFCTPGKDKIITFSPTYGMYKVSAGINDIDVVEIPLGEQTFQPPSDAVEKIKAVADAKILFLCSPNNPTGNSLNNILEIADAFSGITVVDEAYIDFCTNESFTKQIAARPRMVVLQTLSKAYGLAACRIGIAIAGREIISLLNKVKPPYNISLPSQQAALLALQDQESFRHHLDIILEQKKIVGSALTKLSIVEKVFESDANFFLIKLKVDANLLYDYLVENGIIIRNRNAVIQNCIRITIGTEKENNRLIETLKNYNGK